MWNYIDEEKNYIELLEIYNILIKDFHLIFNIYFFIFIASHVSYAYWSQIWWLHIKFDNIEYWKRHLVLQLEINLISPSYNTSISSTLFIYKSLKWNAFIISRPVTMAIYMQNIHSYFLTIHVSRNIRNQIFRFYMVDRWDCRVFQVNMIHSAICVWFT